MCMGRIGLEMQMMLVLGFGHFSSMSRGGVTGILGGGGGGGGGGGVPLMPSS